MRHLLPLLMLSTLSLPLAAQSQIWVVDPAGPITQIADAVALASSGDTILVKPGGYEAFGVVGKSLVIQGDPQATVLNLVLLPFFPGFAGPAVRVSGLAADQRVLLRGLDIRLQYAEPIPALEIMGCAGPVHVEDSEVTSTNGAAVHALGSASVVLTRCTLISEGPFLPNGELDYDPNPGLRVSNSNVFVFDGSIRGSDGYDVFPLVASPPSDGGPGLMVDSGVAYLSGTTVTGGQGGDYDPVFPTSGCVALGDGGPGLVLSQAGPTPSRVVRFDAPVQGGAGGVQHASCTLFPDGLPGPALVQTGGTLQNVPGTAPGFSWDSPVREGATFDAHYEGPPGHHAYLFFSVGISPGLLFEPGKLVLNVDLATFEILFRGVLPPDGSFDETLIAPFLPPGIAAPVTGQIVYFDPANPNAALIISGPSIVTLVDDTF